VVRDVGAIVAALALLMAIAYRGMPVIVFAPICALLAVALSGSPLLPAYTETFMAGASGFIKSFFPIFLLGAIFGKLTEAGGGADSIASAIARALGPARAIPAVVLACAVLTYGGVSLFVVAFAVYPLGAGLFRAANVPKRLLPASIALGAFTFTMDALPGSPQVQNLIPTRYFGTDVYAAPLAGCLGGAALLVAGLGWLGRRRAQAARSGEGYGTGHLNEPGPRPEGPRPNPALSALPLGLVLASNFVLSRTRFSVASWYPGAGSESAVATWALILSLLVGIAATLMIHIRRLRGALLPSIQAATAGAMLAIFNTASEVGFGTVVKGLPGFAAIRGWVVGSSRYVLVSEALAVNVLAGITGSASGGLSIALESMGGHYLEMARARGISPELLHRVASMASGGMDTLPHNGAVITLLAIAGMSHRQSYPDIFALTLIKTAVVFAMAAAFSLGG
jgi:H+/gluconate symporter-like permease